MSYSVQIANIYELLSEDDAPQVKVAAKDTKAAPTKGSAPAKQTQAPQKSQQPKDFQKQTRPPRQDRPPRQPRTEGGEVDTAIPKESHERQGGNRDRKDKGGSFQTGSKRVYDRKPGTGRGREFKKSGGGRANWGKEGEEQAQPVEEGKEKTTEENKEEKTEEKVEEVAENKNEEPVEEEDKTITFEEYMKQKEAPKFDLPAARKPNEGVDKKEMKKWEGYAVLKRDDEEEKEETSTETSEKKEKKPKKTLVPIDQYFDVKTPPINTGAPRGRGGRGRGTRGSPRGAFRGGFRRRFPEGEDQGEQQEERPRGRGGFRGRGRGSRGGFRGGKTGAVQPGQPDTRTESKTSLFVANLPFSLDDAAFGKIFTDAGLKFKAAHVVTKRNGRSKGFGFVEFETNEDQQKALQTLNGKQVEGREITLKVALTDNRENANDNTQTEKKDEGKN